MNGFNSTRLRDIRIARGLTIEQLASLVNVTKQSISKYERSLSIPSPNVIEKIIEVFGIPRNYLSKEDLINPNETSAIFFRAAKATKRLEIELAEIQSKWGYEILSEINTFEKLSPLNTPNFADDLNIEEKASLLRKYWDIGIGSINNLTEILECNGIYVFTINTAQVHVDAYSQIINGIPIVVLNRCKGTSARWRFNLAHELGHLILHKDVSYIELENDFDKIEKEANIFASNFLMPAESFGREIVSSKLDYFVQLKKEWKVSIAAMIYRCNELGIIDNLKSQQLQIQMSKRKWRVEEPLDNEIEFEQPSFLAQQIQKHVIDKTSTEKLINTIRLPCSDIERLCSLNDEYFSKYSINYGSASSDDRIEYIQLSLFQ